MCAGAYERRTCSVRVIRIGRPHENNAAVMAVLLLVIGTVLLGKGSPGSGITPGR